MTRKFKEINEEEYSNEKEKSFLLVKEILDLLEHLFLKLFMLHISEIIQQID